MITSNRFNRFAMIAAAGGVALLMLGCQDRSVNHGEQFLANGQTYASQRLEQTQAAAGARDDATLFPQHFDGGALSSLGAAKLDLMLQDSHSVNPMTVYLAIPSDNLTDSRRLAVGNYLSKHGALKADQIALEMGPNPAINTPASDNIKNLDKADTGSSSSSSSGSSGSSSTGGSSGSSSY